MQEKAQSQLKEAFEIWLAGMGGDGMSTVSDFEFDLNTGYSIPGRPDLEEQINRMWLAFFAGFMISQPTKH